MFHVVWKSNHLSRRLSLLTLLDFGPPSERTVLFDLCVIPPSQAAPINMVTQGMTGCNQIPDCSYKPLALLVGWVSELKKVKEKKKTKEIRSSRKWHAAVSENVGSVGQQPGLKCQFYHRVINKQ